MKMRTQIDQFSYAQKLAALTQLYLELRLSLAHALRAAEADLGQHLRVSGQKQADCGDAGFIVYNTLVRKKSAFDQAKIINRTREIL